MLVCKCIVKPSLQSKLLKQSSNDAKFKISQQFKATQY